MSTLLGIGLGLLCAVLWAASDLIVTHAVGKTSKKWVMMVGQLSGGLMAIIFALLIGKFNFFWNEGLVFIVLVSVFGYLGMETFYDSLKYKGMALSLPITYAWVFVTVVFSMLFYGETLTFYQGTGIALIIIGIIAMTFHKTSVFSFDTGFVFALLAALFFGLDLFLIKIPATIFGALTAIALTKTLTGLMVAPNLLVSKPKLPSNRLLLLMVSVGLLDAIGFFTFAHGVLVAPVSIVASASALTPAFGVVLGLVLFKEKLSRKQGLGVLITLVGILLVAS